MNDGQHVAKNTIFLTIGSIGQKLLSFIYFTLVARLLGTTDTGKYLFALSFMNIFSVFVDLGLQPAIIREIAKDRDTQNTRKVIANTLTIKLLLAALSTAALLLISAFTEHDPLRRNLIALSSIVMILDSIHLTFYAVLRGYEKLKYEAFGMLVGQVITIASGAVVILAHLPLPILMLSLATGSLWNVIYSGIMVARVTGAKPQVGFDMALLKRLAILALPFAFAAIFVKIYGSADTIILGKLSGDTAVAWYGVPYKFIFAFQFIPIALAAALFPAMSRALKENAGQVVKIFQVAQRYLMIIVIPLIVGAIVLAGPLVLTFYGKSYGPSILVMQILAISLFSAFLDFPVGSLLNASHRQNVQTAWMGVAMAVNIILDLLLIPKFGPNGSAVSTVLSNMTLFLGGLAFVPRIIPVPWKQLGWSFLRIGFSAAAMGLLISFTDTRLPLLVSVALGVLVYLGALYAVREVGKRDVIKLRDLVFPGKAPVDQEI